MQGATGRLGGVTWELAYILTMHPSRQLGKRGEKGVRIVKMYAKAQPCGHAAHVTPLPHTKRRRQSWEAGGAEACHATGRGEGPSRTRRS